MGTVQAVIIRQATVDDAPALRHYLAELVAEQLPVFLPLELELFSNNPAAIALYRKVGFVQEGCRRRAACVGGQFVDELDMAYLP